MTTRTLDSPPSILPLYARAAAPMIPGASLLPFVPGGGGEIPELELDLDGVRAEPEAVAAYARVCGFALRDQPAPHLPARARLPAAHGGDGGRRLPLRRRRPRPPREPDRPAAADRDRRGARRCAVRPTPLAPHPKGRTFALVTEVRVGGELVWESESTMLRRGKRRRRGPRRSPTASAPRRRAADRLRAAASAEWRLGGDLGRRYAAVSGDRNPIHMHSLTAKPLGFPAAIAHGMWTKARCLAALESRLPDSFTVDVAFRTPILLPGRVEFGSDAGGEEIDFAVRDAKKHTPHLEGSVK